MLPFDLNPEARTGAPLTIAHAGSAVRRLLVLLALLGVLASVLATRPSPAGATAPTPAPSVGGLVPANGPYYGPILDYTRDSASAYVRRLGAVPSLYGQSIDYPLTRADDTYLREFVQQAADEGALAVVDLDPTIALSRLTVAQAGHLAGELKTLHRDLGTDFYLRFAPEMNGSWKQWGQQPGAYRAAFRVVADVVHATLPRSTAVMVWSPAYGAGYPFRSAYGRVRGTQPRRMAQLDTNGDGRVTDADDPYAPYWPGGRYVDWVGLSLYDYGVGQTFDRNQLTSPGRYADELAGRFGWAAPHGAGRDFIGTYSARANRPMLVESAALYDVSRPAGPGALALKRAWWRQVLSPAVQNAYPTIKAVAWLEQRRQEPEANGEVVDWRATAPPAIARALRHDLVADGITLGPVLRVESTRAAATAIAESTGAPQGDPMRWVVLGAVVLLALYLLAGAARRLRPSWRYPEDATPRDRRLDLFRGVIITTVVITHIEVAGPLSFLCLNPIGAITGAEMFVLLSGIALGMVYPRTVARLGAWRASATMLRRARKLWLTGVGIVLAIFGLGYVPGIDTAVVTTFTDRGTGAAGEGAVGRVYDLFPNAAHLLDYPPPGYIVRDLLLLRIGPWPVNILGIYVVLSLLVPLLYWLLRRRLWWVVLAVSWGLWALDRNRDIVLFHSQFEYAFPLLTWQLPFLHGLVIGHHRAQLVAFLRRGRGLALVSAFVAGYSGFLGVLWLLQNPLYHSLYDQWYVRVFLQPGRLIDLALVVVVAYAFLTAWWTPVARLSAWFFEPLGRRSLYVFVVHVFFVLAVGNIAQLDLGSWWQGLLVQVASLAVIWTMVRTRFLFRVLPT